MQKLGLMTALIYMAQYIPTISCKHIKKFVQHTTYVSIMTRDSTLCIYTKD